MGIGGMLFWTVLAREVYNKHKKKVVFIGKNNQIIKDSIYTNNPHILFEKTEYTININLNSIFIICFQQVLVLHLHTWQVSI